MRCLLAAGLLVLAAAGVNAATSWSDLSDAALRKELRRVDQELATFRDLQTELAHSEKSSSNTARASVIDALQEHMIAVVLRREDALGVEHTIIRHGEPVSGPTPAADVGTPNANKETRRRMRKGTSTKPDAFLRLTWMQQQVIAGERIYRPAIERQAGAFAQYTTCVGEFGRALQEEHDGLAAELASREPAAAPADSAGAPADTTAVR